MLLHHEMGAARVVLTDGPVIDLIAAPHGITQDLGRRDFTVNAMAVSLDEMDSRDRHVDVIDLHNGRADLAAGTLRMVFA